MPPSVNYVHVTLRCSVVVVLACLVAVVRRHATQHQPCACHRVTQWQWSLWCIGVILLLCQRVSQPDPPKSLSPSGTQWLHLLWPCFHECLLLASCVHIQCGTDSCTYMCWMIYDSGHIAWGQASYIWWGPAYVCTCHFIYGQFSWLPTSHLQWPHAMWPWTLSPSGHICCGPISLWPLVVTDHIALHR